MFEGKKGSCKVVFDDGCEYDGEIENGKRHGTGKFTYGTGKFKYMDGSVYEGDWKEDKWDGKGKVVGSDGQMYEGEFKNNRRHGQGRQSWPDGEHYEGGYKNGKRDGTGKYTYHDGNVYEGQWKDSKRNGTGRLSWPDGGKYAGQWKKDKHHGTGTMTYKDGSTYAGEWKDGKKHGSGTFTDANGEKYKRVFNNDERVSNKRVATLINGPPSQRPRTDGGLESVVVLNEEHKECGICCNGFSFDMSNTDDDVRRHLPVLSTCGGGHFYCLGCIRSRQVAIGEENGGVVPERIACMACMEADAFNPSEPRYHRLLIDFLERQFPARND